MHLCHKKQRNRHKVVKMYNDLYLHSSIRIRLHCLTFQRTPCSWPSSNSLWTRPSATRSKSGLWSSHQIVRLIRVPPLNGLSQWNGPHMQVLHRSSRHTHTGGVHTVQERKEIKYLKNDPSVLCPMTGPHDSSPITLIYICISVFVTTVFCALYYTIPACQRCIIHSLY